MRFLLDTNAIIHLLQGHRRIRERLDLWLPADIGVSSVVHHELCFGAYKSRHTSDNLEKIRALQFETVPFSSTDADRSGEIRALLQSRGTPIGPYDVLIAGQAVARALTLVTHNLREFGRVPGLALEDWLA